MAASKKKPSQLAEKFISYLGCPCEIFAGLEDDDEMVGAYKEAVEDGRANGYIPLLIIPDETLFEQITIDFVDDSDLGFDPAEVASRRIEILKDAENVDAKACLDDLWLELTEGENSENYEPGPVEGDNILSYFSSYWDYDTNRTMEVILARIPAAHPWELAAWMPMGGFNDCTTPENQVAVMKRWHEKYGAMPALVASDAWEFTVPEPLSDKEEALKLAYEHYAFCFDRVEQYGRDEYKTGNLADSLMKSTVWYFWWD
ncbi:hypothetical protein C4J81_14435 [Deltaproteobacteria bacterium Smac51]|nr:hypothetical protein C4J81_14435 [Deltaproteobacteria bacterium Smac51]